MIDYWFWAVALATVALVALSKSGLLGSLGMVGVPLLSLVMEPREAAGMLLPLLCVMDLIGVVAFRREVDWRNIRIMLIGGLAGTLIGWALWSVITDAEVLLVVGLLTLVFLVDAVVPWRRWLLAHQHGRIPGPSVPGGIFWGAVAGITSFISHTGGPPAQVYLLPQRLPPNIYSGTTVIFFFVINYSKLVPYYFLGQLSVANLEVGAVLVPAAVAFMLLGVFLVRRISAKLFYQVAYVLVFFIALKLIYDGWIGVFSPGPAT
ncbi:MAG: sulfite exporter TauE/SafE family protein [Devosia sp.]